MGAVKKQGEITLMAYSKALEEGSDFTPNYDANGLITAIVTDNVTGELLMVAHMNALALQLTLDTGMAHFWSRSRKTIWKKGESSGNTLAVQEIRVDCDQDAIWLKVKVQGVGATCHTGRTTCFYRRVVKDNQDIKLLTDQALPLFDPEQVYK